MAWVLMNFWAGSLYPSTAWTFMTDQKIGFILYKQNQVNNLKVHIAGLFKIHNLSRWKAKRKRAVGS